MLSTVKVIGRNGEIAANKAYEQDHGTRPLNLQMVEHYAPFPPPNLNHVLSIVKVLGRTGVIVAKNAAKAPKPEVGGQKLNRKMEGRHAQLLHLNHKLASLKIAPPKKQ